MSIFPFISIYFANLSLTLAATFHIGYFSKSWLLAFLPDSCFTSHDEGFELNRYFIMSTVNKTVFTYTPMQRLKD